MGTSETSLEQEKQSNLKIRVRKLRAEGKTYRKIAEIERVSIAQISRILNESNREREETTSNRQGETAAKVFHLLEKGKTLPQVVIKLKLDPEAAEDLYKKWARLKQMETTVTARIRMDVAHLQPICMKRE